MAWQIGYADREDEYEKEGSFLVGCTICAFDGQLNVLEE